MLGEFPKRILEKHDTCSFPCLYYKKKNFIFGCRSLLYYFIQWDKKITPTYSGLFIHWNYVLGSFLGANGLMKHREGKASGYVHTMDFPHREICCWTLAECISKIHRLCVDFRCGFSKLGVGICYVFRPGLAALKCASAVWLGFCDKNW